MKSRAGEQVASFLGAVDLDILGIPKADYPDFPPVIGALPVYKAVEIIIFQVVVKYSADIIQDAQRIAKKDGGYPGFLSLPEGFCAVRYGEVLGQERQAVADAESVVHADVDRSSPGFRNKIRVFLGEEAFDPESDPQIPFSVYPQPVFRSIGESNSWGAGQDGIHFYPAVVVGQSQLAAEERDLDAAPEFR